MLVAVCNDAVVAEHMIQGWLQVKALRYLQFFKLSASYSGANFPSVKIEVFIFR